MRAIVSLSLLLCSLPLFAQIDRDAAAAVRAASPQIASAYDALAPLDHVQRNSVLRTMLPQTRAALWRAHIGFVVAEHPELTSQQRQAIDAVSAAVAPVLFDSTPAANLDRQAARVDLDNAVDQARRLMPEEMVTTLFYRIGPPAAARTVPPFHAKSLMLDCSCSGEPDDPCALACFGGLCIKLQDGCGPGGADPCMAICHG